MQLIGLTIMEHNFKKQYKNVLIRPLGEQDIEQIRKWRNDSANTQYLRKLPYITAVMQKAWYEGYLTNSDEMMFGIVEQNELKRLVGSMSLYNFKSDCVEFGKILIGDNEAHGRKVGVNALKALTELVFEELNIHKIILHVYAANVGAIKVYKEVGFKVNKVQVTDGYEEFVMEIIDELL